MGMGMGAYNMGMPQMSVDQGKGKGKQIDFDAAFAQMMASLPATQTEGARIEEVDDEGVAKISGQLADATLGDTAEEGGLGNDFQTYVPPLSLRTIYITHSRTGYGTSFGNPRYLRQKLTWRSGRRSSTR